MFFFPLSTQPLRTRHLFVIALITHTLSSHATGDDGRAYNPYASTGKSSDPAGWALHGMLRIELS